MPHEDVAVVDARDNTLLHEPPDAKELDQRIRLLCDFANSKKKGEFLHPVVRSIILHFMIGYDHPFVDGNGRTARALFYWSMAQHGYWMMEYVSVSSIIKAGPSKYARAYLYTEGDDNDTTYFIDFNLRLILRAIRSLHEYLARKSNEIQDVDKILGSSLLAKRLNHRQVALISHALRNPGETYSIESHRKSHNVTYPTARTDLLQLTEYGLFDQRKIGRAFAFRAILNVQERLEELKAELD
jgi:Fic family protein